MDSCNRTLAIRPTHHRNESSSRISGSPSSTLVLILQYQPYLVHFTLDCVAAEAIPRPCEHSRFVFRSLCVPCRSSPALQRSRPRFHRLHVVVVTLYLFYHQSRTSRSYLLPSSAQILRLCLFFLGGSLSSTILISLPPQFLKMHFFLGIPMRLYEVEL